jgi:hypothetical protein
MCKPKFPPPLKLGAYISYFIWHWQAYGKALRSVKGLVAVWPILLLTSVALLAGQLGCSSIQEAPPLSPASAVLPAPLYFISTDGQIWRLERDGATLVQVTHYSAPITGFDLGRDSLIYVTSNDLFQSGLLGDNPVMLVNGPDLSSDDFEDRVNVEITNPRWSGDGRIAFGLNGVNIIPSGGGEPQLLQPNDTVPTLDPSPYPQARFYRPHSWSSGERLLIEYTTLPLPEGSGFKIISHDGTLSEVNLPQIPLCCQATWEPYLGIDLYLTDDRPGQTGLYHYSATTGATTTLLDNENSPDALVRYAQSNGNGWLYFFRGTVGEFPDELASLAMYRLRHSGKDQEMLRSDSYTIGEALWDLSEHGGAVIVESTTPDLFSPVRGPLVWLPIDGSLAATLPAEGHHLRWGSAIDDPITNS